MLTLVDFSKHVATSSHVPVSPLSLHHLQVPGAVRYYSLDFMNKLTLSSKSTLKTFMDIFDPKLLCFGRQIQR